MEEADGLFVRVIGLPDSDEAELALMTGRLRAELLLLDVERVTGVTEDAVPIDAKGVGALTGWLLAQVPKLDGLRPVLAAIADWVGRTGHAVEVSYGEASLKIARATPAQQERIIEDFLARLPQRP